MAGSLRVTQVKSTISHIARNRATVRALGLKRIGHTVEIPDNDATRGMVRQVRFLVTVEEVGGAGGPAAGARAGTAAPKGRGRTATTEAPATTEASATTDAAAAADAGTEPEDAADAVQAQGLDGRPVTGDVTDRALGLGDLQLTGHRPPPR